MTKFTLIYLKPIAWFLSIAVMFQFCKVYYKEPISLNQAIGSDKKRVKIITKDSKEWIFEEIYFKDETLYGILIKPVNPGINSIETIIEKNNIKEIYILDIKKSKKYTKLIVLGTFLGIPLILTMFVLFNPKSFFYIGN